MESKLVIFGTGDIAELAWYYFTSEDRCEISCFTVDRDFIEKDRFCGLPIIPFDEIEKKCPANEYKMFIAISYSGLNRLRAQKYFAAKQKGYSFLSYISPKATIYDNSSTGENCFVFEDNTIQPFVKIGNNVTLWSGNHVGHHSVIEDHCFITSHVVISGGVTIKEYSFIGVNATLRDHITIERENVIGAGSIIMHDTKRREVYVPSKTQPYHKKSHELKSL